MFIHPEILYLIGGTSRCTFMVVFLTTVICQPEERCLRHWLTSLMASAAGCFCMSQSPSYPVAPFPLSLIATTLFSLSLGLAWSGLRRFYHRSVHLPTLMVITLTPGMLHLLLLWLETSQILHMSTTFLVTAIMAVLAMVEILRPPRRRILSQYVVAMAFFIYFLALFIPLAMLVTGVMTMEMMVSGQAAILADQILCILIHSGFIAMTSERSGMTLKHLSETDQLTGLSNRRGLQSALKRQKALYRPGQVLSMIIIDLDHFKAINDRLGHDAGDAVLRQFSQHLIAITRCQDMAVRWGGEEFLILLPDTPVEKAALLAERLRARVEGTPFALEPKALNITISLGVAVTPANTCDFDSVLQNADEALYKAKREGRNRVCCHDPSSLSRPLAVQA
ncbi:hypothetical protein B9G99_09025 [Kushneria konosiri]|uniref:diguanylate cyclase n=2 Tax=Kushneria konosiri TaxID=698828 RepID=A0A2Z2H6S6_9GAMM|nr:hypothetical protein B9G99_09025 [Kushneria konosiri]